MLRRFLSFATGGLLPDLTLLLDVDVEDGIRRKQTGGSEWNRMDAYTLAFHQRVRQGYLDLAHADPGRWVIVDASQPVASVQAAVRQAIARSMPR